MREPVSQPRHVKILCGRGRLREAAIVVGRAQRRVQRAFAGI
jgi:hypothetical protein